MRKWVWVAAIAASLSLLPGAAVAQPAPTEKRRPAAVSALVEIGAVGDSMTYGANSSDGLAYRGRLADRLRLRGVEATIRCACMNGRTVDTIRPEVDAMIAANGVPDIMLWFLGTNDWKWPYQGTLAGWWDRYYNEVRRVMLLDPNVRVVLATVPLAVGFEGLFRNTNAWIRDIVAVWLVRDFPGRVKVAELASLPQSFVAGLPSGGGDSVHPGNIGYELIAAEWDYTIRPWLPQSA